LRMSLLLVCGCTGMGYFLRRTVVVMVTRTGTRTGFVRTTRTTRLVGMSSPFSGVLPEWRAATPAA
jgi:hypothetical protein